MTDTERIDLIQALADKGGPVSFNGRGLFTIPSQHLKGRDVRALLDVAGDCHTGKRNWEKEHWSGPAWDKLVQDFAKPYEEAVLDAFYECAAEKATGAKAGPKPCPTNHNQQCLFTHGFYCEDCRTFFPKDSPTYRKGRLLESIWTVLHNINAKSLQAGGPPIEDAIAMRDKIGVGQKHEDYEALIAEAEIIMAKYRTNCDSASIPIG